MQLCEKASRFTSNSAEFERCENAEATNERNKNIIYSIRNLLLLLLL